MAEASIIFQSDFMRPLLYFFVLPADPQELYHKLPLIWSGETCRTPLSSLVEIILHPIDFSLFDQAWSTGTPT